MHLTLPSRGGTKALLLLRKFDTEEIFVLLSMNILRLTDDCYTIDAHTTHWQASLFTRE